MCWELLTVPRWAGLWGVHGEKFDDKEGKGLSIRRPPFLSWGGVWGGGGSTCNDKRH